MNYNPLVSIVVPVYKSEQFLTETIESILAQSYSNIELILVNDGSPDNSRKICLQYKNIDTRIILIEQINLGPAHAMLNGLKNASGEFVMFLDGDDWIEKNTIKIAVNTISKFNAEMVFWNSIHEYEGVSVFSKSIWSSLKVFTGEELENLKIRFFGLSGSDLKNDIIGSDRLSSGWGKLYKRNILLADEYAFVGKEDSDNLDTELLCRVILHTNTVVYINEYFNHYRRYNSNSLSKNHAANLFVKHRDMFKRLLALIDARGLGNQYSDALNNRIVMSVINSLLSITSPRYSASLTVRLTNVQRITSDSLYVESIKKFNFSQLKVSHRMFFALVLFKFDLFLLIVGYLMQFKKKVFGR